MEKEKLLSRIVSNPEILGGKPIVKGTRISVEFVLELLASGMNIEDILKEYTHLKREDILAVLEFAARTIGREEILPSVVISE